MKNTFAALRELCGEIADLRSAAAVLEFDQQTAMPANGGEGRARQLSLLARLAHERTVSDRMGELLEALEPYRLNCAPESDDFCLLRNLRRDFDRQRRIPSAYVSEFSSLTALAFQNWMEAREADEFGKFAPYLERIFDLRRAYSDFFAPYDHIYDPQLDDHEPGMKTRDLLPLFTHLRREQTRLVEAITARPHPVDALPSGHFPEAMQWALNTEVAGRIGFDFRRGALARSEHPFTTTFHLDDVRITTRLFEDNALSALFSTLHEAGHALYEQNIAPALDRTPLGTGASLGWHESQSRLWENLVGRSRAFWRGFFSAFTGPFSRRIRRVGRGTMLRGGQPCCAFGCSCGGG